MTDRLDEGDIHITKLILKHLILVKKDEIKLNSVVLHF